MERISKVELQKRVKICNRLSWLCICFTLFMFGLVVYIYLYKGESASEVIIILSLFSLFFQILFLFEKNGYERQLDKLKLNEIERTLKD